MLDFSAKYCYNLLKLKTGGNSVERIGNTLYGSKIQLTPHQIDAALFAFKSPFSKGVMLADEVGLGKTIEAGIIIAQYIFEKKDKILVIAPASLLRQWENELQEKFGIPCLIMDRKAFNAAKRNGYPNPFDKKEGVVICSYQMCSSNIIDIQKAQYDLVVIDEAHKLRNVHGTKAVTSKNILEATKYSKKVLLTATPIQNSLMDLYGLSLFIDEDIFVDKKLFQYKFIRNLDENEEELFEILQTFAHRTLRKQVNKYIKFTNRIPKTFSFKHNKQEEMVYSAIRNLLLESENNQYIIPHRQRHLLLNVLCKLMGSSMHAIVYTLGNVLARLERIKSSGQIEYIDETLIEDIDEYDEIESEDLQENEIDFEELEREISMIKDIICNTKKVFVESKYIALQNALLYSFQHLRELGAEEKVVIFTESRKTQDYLKSALIKDGYDGVLTFNGTNTDADSKAIYDEWIANSRNSIYQNRSIAINTRTAILEKFKSDGRILITTEAGAEGLNLQFCSLVINYDLPWNPQRIEQRIGRCHRFGQVFDVVVINFISIDNVVEKRIYELLDTKFSIFNEVLGSSDTVLGNIENGEDLAQSIIDIYTSCRSDEEINEAFDELQEKYKDDIERSLKDTKQLLLDNFDEDLQQFFSSIMSSVEESIGEKDKLFWKLTKSILSSNAVFDDTKYEFIFAENKYALGETSSCIPYSITTNLGNSIMETAKQINTFSGQIRFDISNYPLKISSVEALKGKHGYLICSKLIVDAIEEEEYVFFNAILDDETRLDEDICKKLFRLNTIEKACKLTPSHLIDEIIADSKVYQEKIILESNAKNGQLLAEKIEKINKWADDKIQSTQIAVDQMRDERRLLQRDAERASNLIERKEIEEKIVALSKRIKSAWLSLAESEENIEDERRRMIYDLKKMNNESSNLEQLFIVEIWVE